MPLLLVVTVAEPAKLPLAPLTGAAKVTEAPLTGLLLASFTVACSAVANAVPTVALCGVPAVAVMVPLPLAMLSAAALRVTLSVPELIFQVTFKVCPALPAL
jgi:hypothetical protein